MEGDGPPPTPRHWVRAKAADSPTRLSLEFYGTRNKWPIIYNQNRGAFRWPTSHNAGACIYLDRADPSGSRTSCPPGQITGLKIAAERRIATRVLNVDWWMLTQRTLEDRTEDATGFKDGNT